MGVRLAHVPKLPRMKKAGIDDYQKKKGVKATKKLLNEAAATPLVGGSIKLNLPLGCEIEPQPVEYLVPPYIPKGRLSGIKGNPGDGKTFVSLSIAASLSRGEVPWSAAKCKPVTTLYISYESDAETSTMPRFLAMGGDPTYFRPFTGATGQDGQSRTFTLAHADAVEEAIKKYEAGQVILDPLQSFLGAEVDMHRANETRPLLDGLAGVAKRTGAAIIIIRHLAKSSGGRSVHSGLGSIDIVGAIRSEMLIGSAPDNPENKALVHDKVNDGPRGASLAFVLEPHTLTIDGKRISTARVVWLGETKLTAADLRAPEQQSQRRKTKREQAVEWLREALAAGPRLQTELVEEADGRFSERVLQDAARTLVRKTRRGGKHGPWEWSLAVRKFEAKRKGE